MMMPLMKDVKKNKETFSKIISPSIYTTIAVN